MKRSLLLAGAACLVAVAAEAADMNLTAKYTCSRPDYEDSTNVRTSDMILLCSPVKAKFYNVMSQLCDSLESTPEGKQRLREIQMAAWMSTNPDGSVTIDMRRGNAPRKSVDLYVFSDVASGDVTVFDKLATEQITYTEPFAEQEWEIVADSTATIAGYECVMAQCDYHGRHWQAWFAPELPVPFGPWKLRGLPGLILKAEANGGFAFEAKEVGQTDAPIVPMYGVDNYETTDRRRALADHEYYENNKNAVLAARFGGSVKVVETNPDKPVYTSRYALEPDYTTR